MKISATEILEIEMGENDADAKTVRDYLKKLLSAIWEQGESFSGKRPFGNSGWEYDLCKPLVRHGAVKGRIDPEEGDLMEIDTKAANAAIFAAIEQLH